MSPQRIPSPRNRAADDDGLDAALLRAVASAMEALLCVVDPAGRILLANPALQRFTGRSPRELLGRRFWEVYVAPEHVDLAQDAVRRAIATGRAHPQEGDWLTGDGERRRVAMRNAVLVDEAGQPFAVACLGVDVTDERQREARLHRRAETDLLTGLANRGVLFDVLRRLEATGAAFGVLFCDLDDFKAVNDRHGHAVGDRVLAEAAARLSGLAAPGHVAARFGGDEFVVVCPGVAEAELAALAQRVVAAVAMPFAGPDGPLFLGVSVGTAVWRAGETVDDLIGRADRAMYGVKTHRRRVAARGDAPADPGR